MRSKHRSHLVGQSTFGRPCLGQQTSIFNYPCFSQQTSLFDQTSRLLSEIRLVENEMVVMVVIEANIFVITYIEELHDSSLAVIFRIIERCPAILRQLSEKKEGNKKIQNGKINTVHLKRRKD